MLITDNIAIITMFILLPIYCETVVIKQTSEVSGYNRFHRHLRDSLP